MLVGDVEALDLCRVEGRCGRWGPDFGFGGIRDGVDTPLLVERRGGVADRGLGVENDNGRVLQGEITHLARGLAAKVHLEAVVGLLGWDGRAGGKRWGEGMMVGGRELGSGGRWGPGAASRARGRIGMGG